ncbi:hypothetical protein PV433_02015 [Paenibacillus sp. GYB004]|uniref:hypothetical protein n=1 Tax=Paenibacillus sp. GYB004 TaxID=2994393 RepID=UPI002F96D99A
MSSVCLNIPMKRESKSFTDSLHAILTASGRFDGSKPMLSGLSGMAFKLSVHEKLLPMSVTAYGLWGVEHKLAVDNLGVLTESDGGRTRHPTFRHYRQEAVRWIKGSLDRGVGVIYWIPEFGVIHGYDDEDRIFYIQDGRTPEDQVVLYDNLGLNVTDFWYCRLFGDKVDVPLEAMVLESMRLALQDWDTPHKTLPDTKIASGKLAYSFLRRGLEQGEFDEGGAAYILHSYSVSRREIADYLREVRGLWPELEEAYACYAGLIEAISVIPDSLKEQERGGGKRVNRTDIPLLADRLRKAERLEDEAMELFRAVSRNYPDLKRPTIPRWGTHSPR